tara:strand:- start:1515 stop:2519 length:1005 start_codon:yes stop_codon:yes gene_type:complete
MILVTGGSGYIGSHFVLKLIEEKYDLIVLDNFSRSSPEVIDKLYELTNTKFRVIEGDIRDQSILNKIFGDNKITTVAHFAGLKSVSESEEEPALYYSTNVIGTLNLLRSMNIYGVKKILFSSTATVYQNSHPLPWYEELENDVPKNPYAISKFIIEEILKTKILKDIKFSAAILRYFNPIGAHKSGVIGENITKQDGNLIPSILKVLTSQKEKLNIYGNDYDTPDGTGVRDYIHINDLIDGHIKAMKYIEKNDGVKIWNLGSGKGYSVYEVLEKFEKILGLKIPTNITSRRKGDLDEYWADTSKAQAELGWTAHEPLENMITDTIKFLKQNRLI